MKSKCVFVIMMLGVLLIFTATGICQEKITTNDWVEKIGQGSINWTAGYIEATGIGALPDSSVPKINARPTALRIAKENALRNLLEIAKNVQVDSATKIKDFTLTSDIINKQISGLVQGAMISDQQYMPDGTVEVKLRMSLYGDLTRTVLPAVMAKRKDVKLPATPPVAPPVTAVPPAVVPQPAQPPAATPPTAPPPVAAPTDKAAPAVPPAPVMYSGIIVDARGIGARPTMTPRIFDEDGREIYGVASVDQEYAIKQGMSGYLRDIAAAQTNQRVAVNPLTVKALKTTGTGKSDIVISKANAQQISNALQSAILLKQCRVIIVLD